MNKPDSTDETDQTDETVALAQSALETSPHVALRRLRVEVDEDRVFISGTVSTFYQKQQAQETVRAAVDKCMVVNEVEVGEVEVG